MSWTGHLTLPTLTWGPTRYLGTKALPRTVPLRDSHRLAWDGELVSTVHQPMGRQGSDVPAGPVEKVLVGGNRPAALP